MLIEKAQFVYRRSAVREWGKVIDKASAPPRGQRAVWDVQTPMPVELRAELNGSLPPGSGTDPATGRISLMVAHLLYCRGYRTCKEIRRFLAQELISHDPWLLPDMEPAVERIASAVHNREVVAIYGDFDCDGIMSVAVLETTLRGLCLEPIIHIPDREDGHGLHPEGLASLSDRGVTLIITADCGVGAVAEVQVAHGMGMDVIVTDHHEARADGSLPDCPTVNPRRHDSRYPCSFLCGVGVAYKLAQALHERMAAPDPADLLDLVALGTIADVVPLRDENRSLVVAGLRALQVSQRPGLAALFEVAGVERSRIDPTAVGFYLAPRINAANRMASPRLAYELITASDAVGANSLASRLHVHNQHRQVLVAERATEIMAELGPPEIVTAAVRSGERAPVLLVLGDWPTGVSGLLASRLVETYGLPAFVGADAGEGVTVVSARGVPGVHIEDLLEGCEDSQPGGLFLGYGGHARAGGFRVKSDNLSLVRESLETQVRHQLSVDHIGARFSVDAEVSLPMLGIEAAQQVRTLAPFGMDFSEPLFLARGVRLAGKRPIKDGKHVKLILRQGEIQLDGVMFHVDAAFSQLPLQSSLDIVFHLQINEWNGRMKPELCLRDWRLSPQG